MSSLYRTDKSRPTREHQGKGCSPCRLGYPKNICTGEELKLKDSTRRPWLCMHTSAEDPFLVV